MVKLKKKWGELSIDKKFRIVFALQNFSLFLAWLFLDANFGYLIALSLFLFVFECIILKDRWTKKEFFIFSAIFVWMWFLDNSMGLRSNVDVNYNQLKSYSGITADRSNGRGGAAMLHDEMLLKKDKNGKKRDFFICGIKSSSSCNEELKNYFGRGNTLDQNISVKYYKFSDIHAVLYIIPFFMNSNVVYEMKHNEEVIYDYNYFVSKYHKQQRDLIIFAIYLIVNTLVFCIFYQWIQKKYVQHS